LAENEIVDRRRTLQHLAVHSDSRRVACMGGLLHVAYAAALRTESATGCGVHATVSARIPRRHARGSAMRQGGPLRRRPPGGAPISKRRQG